MSGGNHAVHIEPAAFQYQKGAIKTAALQSVLLEARQRFNTKKVRLKPCSTAALLPPKSRFQYQKGAIKTGNRTGYRLFRICQFQYQKGAIKTAVEIGIGYRLTGFNTKKVRLKLLSGSRARSSRCEFQYQKGAIKTRAGPRADVPVRRPFQYQKGAIKTEISARLLHCALQFQYQKGAIKTVVD